MVDNMRHGCYKSELKIGELEYLGDTNAELQVGDPVGSLSGELPELRVEHVEEGGNLFRNNLCGHPWTPGDGASK